eukprot:2712873-Amphidinium_carterae.1
MVKIAPKHRINSIPGPRNTQNILIHRVRPQAFHQAVLLRQDVRLTRSKVVNREEPTKCTT